MGKSGSGNDWMLFNKSTFPSLISLRINSPNSVFCRVDLVQVKLFELFLFFSLEHQFYFYREMVRGRAGLISFDVDFFRTVRCVLLASVSSDTAIRVCQEVHNKFLHWNTSQWSCYTSWILLLLKSCIFPPTRFRVVLMYSVYDFFLLISCRIQAKTDTILSFFIFK